MHEPLVSIIIPTFNRPDILPDTINNVLAQTWQNTQIIIIDDGTSEKSMEVVKSYNDDRIIYKKTKENLGCAGARMFGIQFSEGDFITFLDDDDEWTNNYLTNQYKIFKGNPSLDFVMCDYQVQSDNIDKHIHNMKPFAINFKKMIHQRSGPFFQCCMFKNKILENIEELMDGNAVPSEDWDFFMNLAMRNPSIGYSPNIDFKWNYSKSSQSANLLSEAKSLNYITNKHKESILQFCGRIVLSDHFRRIARLYEQLDDFQTGKTFYKKAFFSAPWWWKNFLYIILLSLGYKVSTKLIYLGRKYRI